MAMEKIGIVRQNLMLQGGYPGVAATSLPSIFKSTGNYRRDNPLNFFHFFVS
jgi:hypothetical protein